MSASSNAVPQNTGRIIQNTTIAIKDDEKLLLHYKYLTGSILEFLDKLHDHSTTKIQVPNRLDQVGRFNTSIPKTPGRNLFAAPIDHEERNEFGVQTL